MARAPGQPKLLSNFARTQDTKVYFAWRGEDINLFSSAFPDSYQTLQKNLSFAMERSSNIKFNLDGLVSSVDDIPSVVQLGNKGIDYKRIVNDIEVGNVTNWEMSQIMNTQSLFDKTTFMLNGQAVQVPRP